MAEGWIYILVDPLHARMLKIGKTTKTPEERAREISASSGVAIPYQVVYDERVSDCDEAERLIHKDLGEFRVSTNREFFCLPLKEAITKVKNIAEKVGQLPHDPAPEVRRAGTPSISRKVASRAGSPRVRSSYADFEELKEHLLSEVPAAITICMDKHLLERGTLLSLLDKAAADNARLGSNDFLTESRIRTHIKYRREHDGWEIDENARGEFRIVGYRGDVDQKLRTQHMGRSLVDSK